MNVREEEGNAINCKRFLFCDSLCTSGPHGSPLQAGLISQSDACQDIVSPQATSLLRCGLRGYFLPEDRHITVISPPYDRHITRFSISPPYHHRITSISPPYHLLYHRHGVRFLHKPRLASFFRRNQPCYLIQKLLDSE